MVEQSNFEHIVKGIGKADATCILLKNFLVSIYSENDNEEESRVRNLTQEEIQA